MSRGKHLSLVEARKRGDLERFAKEHPAEGDADRFARLLKAMADGKLQPQKAGGSDGKKADHTRGDG